MIGITGSFASGKSSVLKYLQKQNYKTCSADMIVGKLYQNKKIKNQVLNIFPELKEFDKKKIFQIICYDTKKRKLLEDFIHPLVLHEIYIFSNSVLDKELVFVEIPLLFEKKLEYLFSDVILVSCQKELRRERAMLRGISDEIFDLIDTIQMKDEEKRTKTNLIIDTDVDYNIWEKKLDKMLEDIKMSKM